jgi:hypothetical protein
MTSYAIDHRGAFSRSLTPTSFGRCHSNNENPDFRKLISPYVSNVNVFYCPSGGHTTGYWGPAGKWNVVVIDNPMSTWGWHGEPPAIMPWHKERYITYQVWPSDGYLGPQWVWIGPQQDVKNQVDVKIPSKEVIVQDEAWGGNSSVMPEYFNHPHALWNDPRSTSPGLGTGFNVGFHDGHVSWTPFDDAEVMALYHSDLVYRAFR